MLLEIHFSRGKTQISIFQDESARFGHAMHATSHQPQPPTLTHTQQGFGR